MHIFYMGLLNLFEAIVAFLYPCGKHQKTSGCLMFSGGIEIEHCLEMG